MSSSPSAPSFSCLPLREPLLNNLVTLGFDVMTPIQAASLPVMLEGNDVIARAKTGSGKTAAFGLALLQHLNPESFAVQALVLCPTRELAEQVSQSLRRLARLMPNIKILNLSGGIPIQSQYDSLRHSAHIIVGTPGRIQKHLDKETLTVNQLKVLVLDEADRMLDMGFFDDIKQIISFCPKRRQTLLFSATYPDEIKQISKQFMQNPRDIMIKIENSNHEIEQFFYETTSQSSKFSLLKSVLKHYAPSSALIFCNTKQQTTSLTDSLNEAGFSALALNGDLEQAERDQVLIRFVNQSCSILVATDVAARGLDIKELPAVINYDLAFDHDVHIHRIGRTGRAGHKGLAISLTVPADIERINLINENGIQPVVWADSEKLVANGNKMPAPVMVTVCLNVGRKDKVRPGDILGALTKDAGLPGDVIGKIDITPLYSYVAIHRSHIDKAYQYLQDGKLKGRKVSVRRLR